jgi:DNA-binding MarR family transcriptional regulator
MARAGAVRQRDDADTVEAAAAAVLFASRALVAVAARSLAATEATITLPQYRALVLLASRGEQRVGTLADALGIHPSTATRLCNRLVAKHLVVRRTSPDSRREVTVTLSTEGDKVLRSVTNRRRNEIRRIVSRLEPGTRRSVVRALTAFGEAAGEVPDDAWKLGWHE